MTEALVTDSQLRLVFDQGVDGDGKPIYKNKNFNNVKVDATADQLYNTGQALAGLQQHSLIRVERNDSFDLVQTAA